MNLSDHIKLAEMTRSDVAREEGIDNTPNQEQIENMKKLAINVLEPVRALVNKTLSKDKTIGLNITSGLRVPELNFHKRIGGSKTSQHMEGKAADTNMLPIPTVSMYQLVIDSDIEYDQAIFYPNKNGGKGMLHLSYNEGKNRKMHWIEK